jgi:hypothetical protein
MSDVGLIGGGRLVHAHGDARIPLQVEVLEPICAGDQDQDLAVVPVPLGVRCGEPFRSIAATTAICDAAR